MNKADGVGVGRLLLLSFIGSVAMLGGCLPQGDDKSADGQHGLGFAGGKGDLAINRSGKSDSIFTSVAAVPAKLIEEAIGGGEETGRGGDDVPAPALSPSPSPSQDTANAAPIVDTPAAAALESFFRALGAIEGRRSGIVTVLHLGDSHIAADRFSGDMREQFQSRFGNAGRGMVMPGLYLARGVKFDQGGHWEAALSTGSAAGPYGITGAKVSARGREDWLRLTATDRPFAWAEITLQTGPAQGGALVALDGEAQGVPAQSPTPGWTTVRLEKPARELMVRPKGDGVLTVHSVTIGDDRPGVRYINLGVPGATAMTPLSWNPGQLAGEFKRLAPDLIVVGYGTEESFDDALDIPAYEAKVARMLDMLRAAAPNASLAVIGPPDIARLPNFASGTPRAASDVCRALSPQERAVYAKRVKTGDVRLARWHPPLKLDEVRQVLRRAAAARQAFFWDWSKIMGGTCGVHAWAHSDPPLAAADHIHLTEEGSKRSARLLFREVMAGYDEFMRPPAAAAAVAIPAPAVQPAAQPRAKARPAAARKAAEAAKP